jgi:hypothetical protein
MTYKERYKKDHAEDSRKAERTEKILRSIMAAVYFAAIYGLGAGFWFLPIDFEAGLAIIGTAAAVGFGSGRLLEIKWED